MVLLLNGPAFTAALFIPKDGVDRMLRREVWERVKYCNQKLNEAESNVELS